MNETKIVDNIPMGPKLGSAEECFAAGSEQSAANGNEKDASMLEETTTVQI